MKDPLKAFNGHNDEAIEELITLCKVLASDSLLFEKKPTRWTKSFLEFSNVLNTILSKIERTQTSFLNIERTRTCSTIGDQTRVPYFWLQTIEHQTSNLIGPSQDLLTSFFRTSYKLECVHLLVIEL